ncbi:MAG: dipicolinate synthase subunit B [Clostridia bacterium]|nr:dipicolinate synthase subunit B [Clostridia bacterium]
MGAFASRKGSRKNERRDNSENGNSHIGGRTVNGKKLTLGFCITGSFCTFGEIIPKLEPLCESFDIMPIMSFNAYNIDSRFGKSTDFIDKIEKTTGKKIIHTIEGAEPIGAKGLCDVMIIMPCTGNTAAKLALGITDTPVTMAAKGHLRNGRPLVIAISTNDAMAANYKNIAMLQNTKNIYFVPYRQDDCNKKPTSLIADFTKAEEAIRSALSGKQLQPLI